jgi:hypothetical protein
MHSTMHCIILKNYIMEELIQWKNLIGLIVLLLFIVISVNIIKRKIKN